ncbi:MAG: DUF2442 domain-containing protein [Candidatus Kapabacteria bacterium]|nr:DUF2442 domain-containing protein [Candidatus Kapabacteria bacterium]
MITPVKWRVISVQTKSDRKLVVEFVDGTVGEIDLADFIYGSDAGVFVALRDDDEFARAFIEYGAVTWPCGLDLAPDGMWAEITGKDPFDAGTSG